MSYHSLQHGLKTIESRNIVKELSELNSSHKLPLFCPLYYYVVNEQILLVLFAAIAGFSVLVYSVTVRLSMSQALVISL